MPLTALQAVRQSGIVIASDTGEYNKIGEFHPQDATTNPSLVLAAVKKPEYAHIIDRAVQYALPRRAAIEERTQLALDHLLVQVGMQILELIPGRVSVSVDPRLANDTDAIVHKGRALISIFEELGTPRTRVLIKIPATYPGILASRTLETTPPTEGGPIHTNATLIFGRVQALACAQAGMAVISPFIGRVKDWWAAREGGVEKTEQPLAAHPGIVLVRRIRAAYAAHGHRTEVMAAGFRRVEEVLELARGGARGGPDLVTLPPELLAGLRERAGEGEGECGFEFVHTLEEGEREGEERVYVPVGGPTVEGAERYARDIAEEMIVLDKVPEGLAKFSVDAGILEELVRGRVQRASAGESAGESEDEGEGGGAGSVEDSPAGGLWDLWGWPRWLGRLF